MLRGMHWRLFGQTADGREDAANEASEATGGDDDGEPWAVVLTTSVVTEARIAAARLEDEGIPVRIRQEGASRGLPVGVGILGRIDVLTPESMTGRAVEILSDTLDRYQEPDD